MTTMTLPTTYTNLRRRPQPLTLLPTIDKHTRAEYAEPIWLRRPFAWIGLREISHELKTTMSDYAEAKAGGAILTPARAAVFLYGHLERLPYERHLALLLTEEMLVLGLAQIGIGDQVGARSNLRLLTAVMASYPVAGVILAHNHPCGGMVIDQGDDPRLQPSTDDEDVTAAVATICGALQVTLVDHLILPSLWSGLGEVPYYSFGESEPTTLSYCAFDTRFPHDAPGAQAKDSNAPRTDRDDDDDESEDEDDDDEGSGN